MIEKTRNLFSVQSNEQALARIGLEGRLRNKNEVIVGKEFVVYFSSKNKKWHIDMFNEDTVLSTYNLMQVVCYFVELEGSQSVLETLNDEAEFEITVDDFAYHDLPS